MKSKVSEASNNDLLYEAAVAIESHQQDYGLPVRINTLARKLGIGKIYLSSNLSPYIFGKIVKNGESNKYEIYVNKRNEEEERRYTVAHELAHYILHRDDIGDGIEDDALYQSGLSTDKEVEANTLASRMLIPYDFLIEELKKAETLDLKYLGKVFQVPIHAMANRLGERYSYSPSVIKLFRDQWL